ncbi:hypothetical protein MAHJHV60_47290 [Mycobacterium avium subsp. hominissuis]
MGAQDDVVVGLGLAYLDAHADGQYERVHKSMGSDEITTIYMGEVMLTPE